MAPVAYTPRYRKLMVNFTFFCKTANGEICMFLDLSTEDSDFHIYESLASLLANRVVLVVLCSRSRYFDRPICYQTMQVGAVS